MSQRFWAGTGKRRRRPRIFFSSNLVWSTYKFCCVWAYELGNKNFAGEALVLGIWAWLTPRNIPPRATMPNLVDVITQYLHTNYRDPPEKKPLPRFSVFQSHSRSSNKYFWSNQRLSNVYTDMHSEQILPGYTVLVTCSSAASLLMRITINIRLLSRSLYLLKRGQQFRYNTQVYRGVYIARGWRPWPIENM